MFFERDSDFDSNVITAQSGKYFSKWGVETIGALTYSKVSPDTFRLRHLFVMPKYVRRGVGTALVKEFVADIGSGKTITANITNKPSYEELRRLGLLKDAIRGPLTLIGTIDLLAALPIVRTLYKGGISAQTLEITTRFPEIHSDEYTNILETQDISEYSRLFYLTFKGTT